MIREALEYIVGLGKLEQVDLPETTLYTKKLFEKPEQPVPVPLGLHRLEALCWYVNENPDEIDTSKALILIGSSGVSVRLFGHVFGYHAQRAEHAHCTSVVEEHKFGQWQSLERFNIYLRTHFEETPGLIEVLKVTENVASSEIREVVDDGMAQQATVRQGVVARAVTDVPRRVTLRPFVTFPEIEQPDRQFILRLQKEDEETIVAGLFDCDGNQWRLIAADRVLEYLRENITVEEEDWPLILV